MRLTSINPFDFSVKKSKKFFRIEFGMHFPEKRDFRYWWQRRTRGWDDSELWNLEKTIAIFTLPRLKRFREFSCGFPASYIDEKEWNKVVDKMIFSIECVADVNDENIGGDFMLEGETRGQWINRQNKIKEGLKLFGKYFSSLWQ